MKIIVSNDVPPIPARDFDWCAWFEGREEGGPRGWGPTKATALADLFWQCTDRESEHCAEMELRKALEEAA